MVVFMHSDVRAARIRNQVIARFFGLAPCWNALDRALFQVQPYIVVEEISVRPHRPSETYTMERIIPLLVAFALVATSGCMSTHVVKNKARPHVEYDAATERHRQVEGQTA